MHGVFTVDQKKLDDAKRNKEIRQLQKERRTKEHKIKLLESDARRKELVLKRRQEEVGSSTLSEYFKSSLYTHVHVDVFLKCGHVYGHSCT